MSLPSDIHFPSYFSSLPSFDSAKAKTLATETSNHTLMTLAFCSLRKAALESNPTITRELIPSLPLEATFSPDTLSLIVGSVRDQLRSWKSKKSAPPLFQQQLEQLLKFFIDLQDFSISNQTVLNEFQNLPPSLSKVIHKQIQTMGKLDEMRQNPRLLLNIVDGKGLNIIEQLIESTYQKVLIEKAAPLIKTNLDLWYEITHFKASTPPEEALLIERACYHFCVRAGLTIEDPSNLIHKVKDDLFYFRFERLRLSILMDIKKEFDDFLSKEFNCSQDLRVVDNTTFTQNISDIIQEFREKLAEKMGELSTHAVKELEDTRLIAMIAQRKALTGTEDILSRINDLGLSPKTKEDRSALVAIIKTSLQAFPSSYREKDWDEHKHLLLNLLKLSFDKNDPEQLQALMDIIKAAANSHYIKISRYIHLFGFDITQPNQHDFLIEVARTVAPIPEENLSQFIKNYGLNARDQVDREILIEFATIEAKRKQNKLSENIKNYGFDPARPEDKVVLRDLANLAALNKGYLISENIHHYGLNPTNLEDKAVLRTLIKTVASIAEIDTHVSKFLKNYGLDIKDEQDRKVLIETALLCARHETPDLCRYITNYELNPDDDRDREDLIKIAMTAVQYWGGIVIENLHNFGFDARKERDRDVVITIAKQAAAHNGQGTLEFISNLGLDIHNSNDRPILMEIVKEALKGSRSAQFIENCGLNSDDRKDREVLEELAFIAMQGNENAEFIENFGFDPETDRPLLRNLAKIAAQHCGFSPYISSFGINPQDPTDRKFVVELLMLAVQHDLEGVLDNIQKYCLDPHNPEDKKILKEIALFAAQDAFSCLYNQIGNFGFVPTDSEDQATLLECAKASAINNGANTLEHLDNFGIQDPFERRIIELLCVLNIVARGEESEKAFQLLKATLDTSKERESPWFKKFIQRTEETPSNNALPTQAMKQPALLAYALVLFSQKPQPLAISEFDGALLLKASDYRDFTVAQGLVETIYQNRKLSQDENIADKILSAPLLSKYAHLQLPVIIFSLWVSDLSHDKNALDTIISFLVNNQKLFRDKTCTLTQIWFTTIYALNRSSLSHKSKLHLLAQTCRLSDPQSVIKALSLIQTLSLSKDSLILDREWKADFLQDLTTLALDDLKSNTIIDLTSVENVMDKYLRTFHNTRYPNALKIYEARIRSITNPLLREVFQRFVISVLEGTFTQERYRTDINPHLKTIESHFPQLFEEWKTTVPPIPLSEALTDASSSTSQFRFADWLKDQWRQGHFNSSPGKHSFPLLERFFKDPHERKTLEQELKDSILHAHDGQAKKTLAIQQLCLALCESDSSGVLSEKEISSRNARLQSLAEKTRLAYPQLEFTRHLQDLFISLKATNIKSNTLSIVDTDQWEDLFLCGTEVSGSCQRVDGRPHLNKALLAYVMDGKNRLVAVKDAQGKIVARCIFRLLWNPQAHKPVLFQERIYPTPCNPDIEKALNLFTLKRAQSLRCELLTINERDDLEPYSDEVVSLGGSTPFEYVDADGGISDDSEFSILESKKVSGT